MGGVVVSRERSEYWVRVGSELVGWGLSEQGVVRASRMGSEIKRWGGVGVIRVGSEFVGLCRR